jgi:CBS domain-containing protein
MDGMRAPVQKLRVSTKTGMSTRPKHRGRQMTTIASILKHKGYQVSTIEPMARVDEILQVLIDKRIGAVLVIDKAEQILGIVSERDIVRSLHGNGLNILDMTAGQIMTRALHVARPETTVAEAMHVMTAGRFRHLPVVDRDTLVGIISIGDVVKARIMQQDAEVESLTAYVAGSS